MPKEILAKPHFSKAISIKEARNGFSFVHASDTHVAKGPFLAPREYTAGNDDVNNVFCLQLEQWIDTGHLDFVLITGDLADTGLPNDISKAKWFVFGNESKFDKKKEALLQFLSQRRT